MNPHELPPLLPRPASATRPSFGDDQWLAQIPWRSLFRQFIAGNPFYIISAAMMLYGIYLVSIDPQMLHQEASQLAFNFSSLQLYEVLLIVTAIVLAARKIWYDCTLLICLENLFVFVPFILISQATLLDNTYARIICSVSALFAAIKLWGLQHYIAEFRLPRPLTCLGLLLLAANLAFPLHFRRVIEESSLTWTDQSPWLWFLLLPGILAGANLLPRKLPVAGQLILAGNRFAYGLLALWLAVTAAHLRSLDYLDGQPFHPFLLVPFFWVTAWTLYHRIGDFMAAPSVELRPALLLSPVLITLTAATYPNANLFLALSALNFVLYAGLFWKQPQCQLIFNLLLASAAAMFASLPTAWMLPLIPHYSREKLTAAAALAYGLIQIVLSKQPRLTVLGAFLIGYVSEYLLLGRPYAEEIAMQNGLIFLLIHSLRWDNPPEHGAEPLRVAFAIAWSAHSLAWGYIAGLGAAPFICFGFLLVSAACTIHWLNRYSLGPRSVYGAALFSLCTIPANYVIDPLKITPTGYLVVLGSFIVFALGTALALTKNRWRHDQPQVITALDASAPNP